MSLTRRAERKEGRPLRPFAQAYQDFRVAGIVTSQDGCPCRANCAWRVAACNEQLAFGRVFVQSSGMQSASERSETQGSTESFAGVSLVQLAAVAAARAQGFSLEEVLHAEGLAPQAYRAADIAYKSRLVDAAQRERLATEYQKELAQAEDRLGRKVSPLDEDVDAWVRFLGTYGTQSAPADWLTTLGLTLPDLSRLSRGWKTKLETDEGLRKRAEKSAKDKKPYDISSLRVSPAKLVPSPLAKPFESSAQADVSPLPASPVVKRWMPKVQPVVEAPAAPLPHQAWAPAVDIQVKPVAPSPLAVTNPVFSLPKEDVLPFVARPEVPDEPPKPEEQAAALAPPREALSGTSLSLEIPRGPATPFAASNVVVPAAEKPKPIEMPKVQPAPTALGGTSLAVDIPRGPATPFKPQANPAPIEEKPAVAKMPQVKPAPAALGGTSLAVDIPRGSAMPFAKGKEPPVIEEKPQAPAKPIVSRPPDELSGTSLAVNIPRGPATPFGEVKPAAPREDPAPRPPPKEEKPVYKPQLSLEQHAAMTVEIATYPAHAMAILKRYGVTPPQKVDMDRYYQGIVASDPAKQAAWHAAYGAHYAALMRTPRR